MTNESQQAGAGVDLTNNAAGATILANQIGNLPPEVKLESNVAGDGFAERFANQLKKPTADRSSSDREATTAAAAPRERTTSFGGPRLKLSVIGRIEGYHLYWANDQDSEIEILLSEGFLFATPEEVKMQSHIVADSDLSDRVSRYVGSKEDGSPLRAYLMKCTNEHWRDREDDRLRQANDWEQSITKGLKVPGTYQPSRVENSIDTRYKKEY